MSKPIFILFALCLVATPARGQSHAGLAKFVGQAMQGRQGAAVILDVRSGKVLAAYDLARAGQRLVRPGSAIKPFVLATLADHRLLSEPSEVHCSRQLNISGRKLNCGHPALAGSLGAEQALAYSCNTYFTTMGAKLTPAQLRDGLQGWGIASRVGLVKDETAGRIDLSQSREQTQLQCLGEENVKVTPLGLLQGYLRLARERRTTGADAHAVVFRGLEAATKYGMARLAQPAQGIGLRVAGKTGTSMAAEGPWTHGWFAGYAPSDSPEIVLMVFIENGSGPADAAPVAQQLFEAWARERGR